MKRAFIISFITLLSLFLVYGFYLTRSVDAKVTGACYNCHTMHNSQDGSAVLRTGSGTGWNGSGQLAGGGIQSTPAENLLITNCVGCHSSSTGDTIITVGSNQVPIVYNTGAYPANPLAGGNFYQVAQGGATNDQYGHNVYGIAGADNNLNEAPGTLDSCGANECHQTLAASSNSRGKPGCQGCHFRVFHHVEDNATSSNTGYRFLWGHTYQSGQYTAYVEGVEDNDWEQETTIGHNWYKGATTSYSSGANGLANTKSITAFCSGCHGYFHNNMGSSSPWIRHPNDIALPQTGEYSAYDPTTNYSSEAPVAWADPTAPARAGAIVMCLSCHRPHGSEQPDMLRWDYSGMVAGGGTNSAGCFTCHTTKDDGS